MTFLLYTRRTDIWVLLKHFLLCSGPFYFVYKWGRQYLVGLFPMNQFSFSELSRLFLLIYFSHINLESTCPVQKMKNLGSLFMIFSYSKEYSILSPLRFLYITQQYSKFSSCNQFLHRHF